MSSLKNDIYVREFAFRTKMNYYRNMRKYSDNTELYHRKITELISQMKEEEYVIEDYYEVTDLLNSMIGLLVFPQQSFYEGISCHESDLQRFFPTLYSCTQSEYVNTYKKRGREDKNSPRSVIRHIRNSLSHDRVMIYPRNNKDESRISKIIFQDCDIKENNQSNISKKSRQLNKYFGDIRNLETDDYIYLFSIEIAVEKLEDVVMEICDNLLR